MVIGTRDIDLQELNRVISQSGDIVEYALNTVPRIVRHNINICNNQRYYIALLIRRNDKINYYSRMELCNKLLDGIEIFGIANEIIDFTELVANCNVTDLLKYTFKDEI